MSSEIQIPDDLQEDYADFAVSSESPAEGGWRFYARELIERIARVEQERDFAQGRATAHAITIGRLEAQSKTLAEALAAAELDCRGYDALHGWLEQAIAALKEYRDGVKG